MLVCGFLDAAETWTVSDILQFTAAEEDGAVSNVTINHCTWVIGDFIIRFSMHFWMDFFYD